MAGRVAARLLELDDEVKRLRTERDEWQSAKMHEGDFGVRALDALAAANERAEKAEAMLDELRLRFQEHAEAAAGDRQHTWMDAVRYVDELAARRTQSHATEGETPPLSDDYKQARGAVKPAPGADKPEVIIRRMRDGHD